MAQVALIGALLFFSVAVFTFAKPEQEDWQAKIQTGLLMQTDNRADTQVPRVRIAPVRIGSVRLMKS